ncbi:hypothetical protein [Nocardioides sp. SYSU D00038]|uniref:hypothetical protein n=1 Tax=Nocardioides sp. SYSU D00038 TaxID=2812554 RepID=UPI0019682AC7|nr:hypothetical protein [Nocardioides sp. SYSU D00038]
MTVSEASTDQPPPPRRRRVRELVANRPLPQRVGAVVGVLILLTAPFGGLREATGSDTEPIALDQRIDIGPFHLTVTKVVSLPDLAPVAEPEPGNRVLAIRFDLENHTDEPVYAERLIRDAFGSPTKGFRPWPGEESPEIEFFFVDDTAPLGTEYVNPGTTADLVGVLHTGPTFEPEDFELEVYGFTYQVDEIAAFRADEWGPAGGDPLAAGPLEVAVED